MLLLIWHMKRPEWRSTEGNNKSSAPSLPTHAVTSKKPRFSQSKGRPLLSGSAWVSSSVLLSHIKDNVEILDMLIRVPSVWWNPITLPHSQALEKQNVTPYKTNKSDCLAVWARFGTLVLHNDIRCHPRALHVNMFGNQLLSLSVIGVIHYGHYLAPLLCATTAA